MPPEQDAGAIIIALKAQIESLEKGFAKAKETLKGFGRDTDETAKKTQQSGEKLGATFDAFDRRGIRLGARTAMMTQRLIGLQFAIGSLAQSGGSNLGRFQGVVSSTTAGLQGFAAVAAVFPTPAGLVAAAGVGIATAFAAARKSMAEASEQAKKTQAEFQKRFDTASRSAGAALFADITAGGKTGRLALQVSDTEATLKRTLEERAVVVNNIAKAENEAAATSRKEEERKLKLAKDRLEIEILIAKNPAERRLQGGRLGDIDRELAAIDKASAARNRTLAQLRGNLVPLEANVQTATDELGRLNRELGDSKAMDAYTQSMTELHAELRGIEGRLQAGLIKPSEAAEERAKNLNRQLEVMIEHLETLKKSGDVSGSLDDAIRRIKTQEADAIFEQAFALDAENAKAKKDAKNLFDKNVAGFHDRFTVPFSEAVGLGIADGIMQGAPAMQTLANVGRNLFGNFLMDSVRNFQDGMISAFKGIAGAGGELLGSTLTGLIGVVGGIFAQRQSKSSSTFTGVQSRIESSQALRGVVAGPSNVSIAAVGEDLARAVAPVVERLDAAVAYLLRIERNTRSGRGGGGGGGGVDAVGVPTA